MSSLHANLFCVSKNTVCPSSASGAAVEDTMPVIVQPVGTAPDDPDPQISSSTDGAVAVRLGYFLFTNLGGLLAPADMYAGPKFVENAPNNEEKSSTVVNSHIIGASVNDPRISLKLPEGENVTLKMYHLKKQGVDNPRCVYWDIGFK